MSMGVIAGSNDSGFHGYPASSMYPSMFSMPSQHDQTMVDPDEQQAVAGVEDPAPRAVNSKTSMGIIGLFVGLIVLMLIFGIGR
ncbi:hypothetical protein [Erysipelothrix tonsillarum]|uniref:hypothetical protein n=1 Tax=Erysipelothrix tonsillarum TaxID=38402 RepID=UPI0039C7E036